jgi:hypothetical protein
MHVDQRERLQRLNDIAIRQMKALTELQAIKQMAASTEVNSDE